MTITPRIGCFGSAVMFRRTAPECRACPHILDCARTVRGREQSIMRVIVGLDAKYETSRESIVARWWTSRWKVDKESARKQSRCTVILERWSAIGANVYHLRHRTNPIASHVDAQLHQAFQFICDEPAFKPRDLAEHLRDSIPSLSKASATAYATDVCDALLSVDVLKKEGRGVLCLN